MFCREYDSLFEKLAITESEEITNVSGCLKPCHYKKYNFLGEPSPSSFKSEHYIFSLWAVSSKPKWRRRSWSTQCQPWWQSLMANFLIYAQKLSGRAKTFRSTMQTRRRGFWDSARASQKSYALGRQHWTVSGDKYQCYEGKEYSLEMKLTGCNETQFTCDDGQC